MAAAARLARAAARLRTPRPAAVHPGPAPRAGPGKPRIERAEAGVAATGGGGGGGLVHRSIDAATAVTSAAGAQRCSTHGVREGRGANVKQLTTKTLNKPRGYVDSLLVRVGYVTRKHEYKYD